MAIWNNAYNTRSHPVIIMHVNKNHIHNKIHSFWQNVVWRNNWVASSCIHYIVTYMKYRLPITIHNNRDHVFY